MWAEGGRVGQALASDEVVTCEPAVSYSASVEGHRRLVINAEGASDAYEPPKAK